MTVMIKLLVFAKVSNLSVIKSLRAWVCRYGKRKTPHYFPDNVVMKVLNRRQPFCQGCSGFEENLITMFLPFMMPVCVVNFYSKKFILKRNFSLA